MYFLRDHQIYINHFELLEKESSLLGLLSAPRGISILFIDNKHLFFIMGKEYSSDENESNKLLRQLKNGFYFEEYNYILQNKIHFLIDVKVYCFHFHRMNILSP